MSRTCSCDVVDGAVWERRGSLKRSYGDQSSPEDHAVKRSRIVGVGGGEETSSWLPALVAQMEEEEQVLLAPPAAACFPLIASSCDTTYWTYGDGVANGKPQSDSGSSSGARSPSPETGGNGSASCIHPWGGTAEAVGRSDRDGNSNRVEQPEEGLELVRLLAACAECIAEGNHQGVSFTLSRLGELASPTGASIHRVAAYFTEALALRAAKLWPRVFSVDPSRSPTDPAEDDDGIAWRVLDCVGPVPKFLHLTANERLLRAFEGKDRVHVVDFDIRQGLQWPSLLQGLASRPNPPGHVRITGVGECRRDLGDTGARLTRIAAELNLPFRFHAVVDRLEDVRLWMLHVKRGECVAVNCVLVMHKVLYDGGGGALRDLLGLIRSTNPAILVMAEQEAAGHNGDRWETRLPSSLRYYAAMFDSLDHCLRRDCPARIRVEEMLAREIRNIVACEGSERVERHECFDRWKKMLTEADNGGGGGFECAGMGDRETLHSRMVLRMYSCDNYSVDKRGDEGADGVTLNWFHQPLYTVSAWEPVDATTPGSSSSSSSSSSATSQSN